MGIETSVNRLNAAVSASLEQHCVRPWIRAWIPQRSANRQSLAQLRSSVTSQYGSLTGHLPRCNTAERDLATRSGWRRSAEPASFIHLFAGNLALMSIIWATIAIFAAAAISTTRNLYERSHHHYTIQIETCLFAKTWGLEVSETVIPAPIFPAKRTKYGLYQPWSRDKAIFNRHWFA